MAQRTIWQPGGDQNGTGLWADPDNWSNGLPGSDVAADGRAIFKGGEIFVDSDVSPAGLGLESDYALELGDNKDDNIAKLTIEDGGHVGALRESRSMVGIWSPAILIVEEGGSFTVGNDLHIGSVKNYDNGNADMATEVHLNGGTITVNKNFGIDYFNDKEFSGGILFMNGGSLILTSPSGWASFDDPDTPDENMSIGKNGKIEYTSGLIQLAGDHKESLEAYVSIGRITGEFGIWVEQIIEMVDDGAGGEIADTTYVTKLSNDAPGQDATLSDLTLSEGTLDPAFDAATYDYAAELPAGTTATPTVTVTAGDADATVDVTDATDVTSETEADRTTTIVVTAVDGATQLTYSVVFNVSATGVHDMEIDNLIYPNPASSKLNISHSEKIERVEIFSITGSRVLRQNNITTEAIDISNLKSGIYFISVIDVNNNNIVRKFMKQ